MIGLTGGLGAGKSSVSQTFGELGAVVVDADKIAREALAPGTPGIEAVEEIFGAEVIAPDGTLDRPALAKIVFSDPAARKLLNALTHPFVYQESTRLQRAAPRGAIVVHDIPLIIENGVASRYHLVVVVHASERTRVRRVMKGRGLSEADALARIRSQADDDARRAAADVWLKNEGSGAELRAAAGNLWFDRLVPFNDNMLAGRVAAGGGEVRPPDRDWPAQAARLAARIRFVAGGIVQAIRHTGPTSRGEAAVDVIDLEVDVRDQGEAEHLRPILVAAGFPAEPGSALRHGSADPGRPARVLIRPRGGGVGGGTYR